MTRATENAQEQLALVLDELSKGNVVLDLPGAHHVTMLSQLLGLEFVKMPMPGKLYYPASLKTLPPVMHGYQFVDGPPDGFRVTPALPQSLGESSSPATQLHIDIAQGRESVSSRPTRKVRMAAPGSRPSRKLKHPRY